MTHWDVFIIVMHNWRQAQFAKNPPITARQFATKIPSLTALSLAGLPLPELHSPRLTTAPLGCLMESTVLLT